MRTDRLHYDLPSELIAQRPASVRSESRLLVYDRGADTVADRVFSAIGEYLRAGDCLVLNDTKVVPARFFAQRKTGGRLEGLFLSEPRPGVWSVMLKGAGKVKTDETIALLGRDGQVFAEAQIEEKTPAGKVMLRPVTDLRADALLGMIGFAPLPPYIRRGRDEGDAETDLERYQTVYAEKAGAVAAPTAGLHFTQKLLAELRDSGVKTAYVTLHVGEGTFRPVSAETLADHPIHSEVFEIDGANAAVINAARHGGGRIVAVGTTTVRVLETIANDGAVDAAEGTTSLFIQPPYEFQMVDAMVTNFHLPRSTLLALVAAFAGLDRTLELYRHAVEQRYRFYSYGDAMLIF